MLMVFPTMNNRFSHLVQCDFRIIDENIIIASYKSDSNDKFLTNCLESCMTPNSLLILSFLNLANILSAQVKLFFLTFFVPDN